MKKVWCVDFGIETKGVLLGIYASRASAVRYAKKIIKGAKGAWVQCWNLSHSSRWASAREYLEVYPCEVWK